MRIRIRPRTPLIMILLLLPLLLIAVAGAETADLEQTVTDLNSQTDDKERMDTLGSSKVEINQIRTWLSDAANAIKEEDETKCRKVFERARIQLKLIDEQVALSKLDEQARGLEQQVSAIKQKADAAKRQLEEKQAKLRALKMMGK